jgi:hypothetical protein
MCVRECKSSVDNRKPCMGGGENDVIWRMISNSQISLGLIWANPEHKHHRHCKDSSSGRRQVSQSPDPPAPFFDIFSREYQLIYRGQVFLPTLSIPSPSGICLFFSVFLCVAGQASWRDRAGWGGGGG